MPGGGPGSAAPGLHRGARVEVTGRDLHVAQVNASIEHGRDERAIARLADQVMS
jgi:hypothetical protein